MIKTPHPRAELIRAWLEDTSQPVWRWIKDCWCRVELFSLIDAGSGVKFAIGPKPTQPPARMCVLAGVEFPEPMRDAPERTYWVANLIDLETPCSVAWDGDAVDAYRLKTGQAQVTREGAIQQGRAMLAALKAAVEVAR